MGDTDELRNCVLQCQNGDHEAFEPLIQAHQRMIHSLTFRMTGSLADAQDLAQETFIQAFQCIGEFRGESAFSSWLYRIAMNKCLNWRKRQKRQQRLRDEWESVEPRPERADDSPTDQIQRALLKLPPKQRAAVVLTIYEGQSHAEAARTLGCSETTVSWRVFSAKRKLRRWLKAPAP